jgi:DNA polymerase elongation subunit (family B)
MERKAGIIPRLKDSRYPRSIIIIDTEAYRGEKINGVETQTLRFGVSWYGKLDNDDRILDDEYYRFESGKDIATYIDQRAKKDSAIFVYAHNLVYDLQLSGLLPFLIEAGYEITTFVIEDPPTYIFLERGRSVIRFIDTFNYFQFSIEEMGKQLGLEKLTIPENEADNQLWFEYCKRDVEVLRDYLLGFIKFLRVHDLAGLAYTLAGQAFRTYRHRFMTCEIETHTRDNILKLERAAYAGGRSEAFYIGKAPSVNWYKVDVNSMYPYVMREQVYPTRLIGYSENISVERLRALIERYYVIAEVSLDTDQPVYPYRMGHKLIFPVGQFVSTLHKIELENALAYDHIDKVNKVAIYDEADIFSEYVNYWYRVKVEAELQGNKIQRQIAKLFLNSLYGKFGQRGIQSEVMENPDTPQYGRITGYSEALGTTVEINYLGTQIEIRYQEGEAYYACPAIAGAVTAYARMYLWYLMTLAGKENVKYCDTDSLIVNEQGYQRLSDMIDSNALGKLKLEGVETHLIIHSVKDYEYGVEVHRKGVPKNAVVLVGGRFEYDQFRGGKTWVKDGLNAGIIVTTRIKERRGSYDKGIVLPDGSVIPLTLICG